MPYPQRLTNGPLQLSVSYRITILKALIHEGTPQALETLWELESQGWRIPPWIKERMREALPTGDSIVGFGEVIDE